MKITKKYLKISQIMIMKEFIGASLAKGSEAPRSGSWNTLTLKNGLMKKALAPCGAQEKVIFVQL